MTQRVIIGQRYSGEYGIWVSRPGKSVFSNQPEDFLLSMDGEQMQYVRRGSFSSIPLISGSGSSWTYGISIPHSLGYIPFYVFSGGNPSDNGTDIAMNGSCVLYASDFSLSFTVTVTTSSPPAALNVGNVSYIIYKPRMT